jgi:hypothetical protein
VRRRVQVAIDCFDPGPLAAFWIEALGYTVSAAPGYDTWAELSAAEAHQPGEEWHLIEDRDGVGPTVLFHRVPEPKSAKNRLHLDIFLLGDGFSDDQQRVVNAEADRLVKLGATRLRTVDDDGEFYVVMHDPEGNEFCIA